MNDEFDNRQRQSERAEDRHQKEREVLFANEIQVVKILQAVSGAAMIGGLSQADTLIDLAGIFSFLVFLSAMGLALVAAVLAVYWKHQYKLYDVKGRVAKDEQKQARNFKRSNRYLTAMRAGMRTSLVLIALGVLQLIVFLWIVGPNSEEPADNVETSTPVKLRGEPPALPFPSTIAL